MGRIWTNFQPVPRMGTPFEKWFWECHASRPRTAAPAKEMMTSSNVTNILYEVFNCNREEEACEEISHLIENDSV